MLGGNWHSHKFNDPLVSRFPVYVTLLLTLNSIDLAQSYQILDASGKKSGICQGWQADSISRANCITVGVDKESKFIQCRLFERINIEVWWFYYNFTGQKLLGLETPKNKVKRIKQNLNRIKNAKILEQYEEIK